MLATGRVMAQSLSVALAGAAFAAVGGATADRALAAGSDSTQLDALRATFLRGFGAALQTLAVVAAIAAVTSFVRGNDRARAR
jgi:hypothetical protein